MSRRAGFTLIELLVAIALGATLIVTIYAILEHTLRARAALDAAAPPHARLALETLLSQDLAGLDPDHPPTQADAPQRNPRIDWITHLPHDGLCLPTEVSYWLRDGVLYRRQQPLIDDRPTTGGTFEPLLADVTSLQLITSESGPTLRVTTANWQLEASPAR